MKKILIALSTTGILFSFYPSSVKSKQLPFAPNCKAMQNYFNRSNWSPQTKFSDFRGKPMFISGSLYSPNFTKNYVAGADMICSDGYAIQTSPMGKTVCNAKLTWRNDGSFRWDLPKNGECRDR